MLEHLSMSDYNNNFYKIVCCENVMTADNQQGRTKKVYLNKYRIRYESIYRDKEWVELTKNLKLESDRDAIEYTKAFIERQNKKGKKRLERFELIGIEKIVQEEKTVRLKIS